MTKSRLKWLRLSSARTICGRRRLPSLRARQRLLMMRIVELEERSYLQEEALLVALRHMGFNFKIFRENAQITLH
jgi:hypothetical protein